MGCEESVQAKEAAHVFFRSQPQATVLDHDDVVSTFRHPDYQELFSCTESFPPLLLWPLLLLPLFVFLTCLAVTGASDVAG